ncbi:NADPH-dependent FMN reductase [Mesobacillus thioparans]|uniref:NADPH-dependent FMN reductase n=1 Tax=Mesobacillus thioparans TaxID=370439 RepID=UPI0039EE7376
MNVLVINGSPRELSKTRGLAYIVKELLTQKGIEVSYFDVGEDMLPLFNGNVEQKFTEAYKKLDTLAKEADAFFICTPEYHSAMSGALKNTFDFLDSTYFSGKFVGIGAVAGGGKGGINALNNLRTVLRAFYAIVLPNQIVCDDADFSTTGHLVNKENIKRVNSIIEHLIVTKKNISI